MISERSISRVLDQFSLHVNYTLAHDRTEDVQIILDASASMTAGVGLKERRARELAIALLRIAARNGRSATLSAARGADRDRVVEACDSERLAHLPFDGTSTLAQRWPDHLAASSGVRIVLSDFLFPGNPKMIVERVAAGTGKLFLVQLLDPEELNPQSGGRTRLVDVETEEAIVLAIDPPTVERYKSRLKLLQQSYADACEAAGAVWISISVSDELEEICRERLVTAGLLFDGPSDG
jgi:uncharacterized protein (DUF58 family)